MLNNDSKTLTIKKEYVWIFALTLFFAINLNLDWNSNRLVWYGCLALLFVAYLFVFNGKILLKGSRKEFRVEI